MEIAKKKLSELKPAPYNPRKIDKETLEKLKQSIQNFGYVEPLVWNKRTKRIVGGNQRLRVLQELGVEEVEVVVVDLDEDREKLLNLALNKITGEWDFLKLAELFESLKDLENVELSGFEISEIEDLIGGLIPIEPDESDLDVAKRESEWVRIQIRRNAIDEVVSFLEEKGIEYKL